MDAKMNGRETDVTLIVGAFFGGAKTSSRLWLVEAKERNVAGLRGKG
jgi:hypothetical protein